MHGRLTDTRAPVASLQSVIKPFSGRIGSYASTVSSCSPSAGTVSAASISNTGPGPDAFLAPDSKTCCSSAQPRPLIVILTCAV